MKLEGKDVRFNVKVKASEVPSLHPWFMLYLFYVSFLTSQEDEGELYRCKVKIKVFRKDIIQRKQIWLVQSLEGIRWIMEWRGK